MLTLDAILAALKQGQAFGEGRHFFDERKFREKDMLAEVGVEEGRTRAVEVRKPEKSKFGEPRK